MLSSNLHDNWANWSSERDLRCGWKLWKKLISGRLVRRETIFTQRPLTGFATLKRTSQSSSVRSCHGGGSVVNTWNWNYVIQAGQEMVMGKESPFSTDSFWCSFSLSSRVLAIWTEEGVMTSRYRVTMNSTLLEPSGQTSVHSERLEDQNSLFRPNSQEKLSRSNLLCK